MTGGDINKPVAIERVANEREAHSLFGQAPNRLPVWLQQCKNHSLSLLHCWLSLCKRTCSLSRADQAAASRCLFAQGERDLAGLRVRWALTGRAPSVQLRAKLKLASVKPIKLRRSSKSYWRERHQSESESETESETKLRLRLSLTREENELSLILSMALDWLLGEEDWPRESQHWPLIASRPEPDQHWPAEADQTSGSGFALAIEPTLSGVLLLFALTLPRFLRSVCSTVS